jgi:ABC-type phosphate/phosphonate transport system substrate-binding protein
MRRWTFLALCGIGLVGLSFGADETNVKVGVSQGLFPGKKGKDLTKAADPFRDLFRRTTGLTGTVTGAEGPALSAGLKKDEFQLAVFQGIEYAWALQDNPKLQPIALCVNESRSLKALLFVRADSAIKKPADLKGQTLALEQETREHCMVFLRQAVIGDSTPPSKFFKKVTRTDDVEAALDDVADGNVAAAVVDGLAWSSYRKAKPGVAKRLRVLAESDPFPGTVLACQSGRFSDGWVKQVRNGLIGARKSSRNRDLLQRLRLTGFEAPDAEFDKLVKDVVKAYPPPK